MSHLLNRRFYVDRPVEADHAVLSGTEAHHLLHVLRVQVGQEVTLFDGSGHEYMARVTQLRRSQVMLQIVQRQLVDRELPVRLMMAVALPKGDRQRWLVEKCVELGVTALVPLRTARGVAQPVASALKRLERSVIEASKQCGRNRLMEVGEALELQSFLEQSSGDSSLRLIAHPHRAQPLAHFLSSSPKEVRAVIGPEGGLTDEELQMAQQRHWQIVELGPRILRVETAALVLAAAMQLKGERGA